MMRTAQRDGSDMPLAVNAILKVHSSGPHHFSTFASLRSEAVFECMLEDTPQAYEIAGAETWGHYLILAYPYVPINLTVKKGNVRSQLGEEDFNLRLASVQAPWRCAPAAVDAQFVSRVMQADPKTPRTAVLQASTSGDLGPLRAPSPLARSFETRQAAQALSGDPADYYCLVDCLRTLTHGLLLSKLGPELRTRLSSPVYEVRITQTGGLINYLKAASKLVNLNLKAGVTAKVALVDLRRPFFDDAHNEAYLQYAGAPKIEQVQEYDPLERQQLKSLQVQHFEPLMLFAIIDCLRADEDVLKQGLPLTTLGTELRDRLGAEAYSAHIKPAGGLLNNFMKSASSLLNLRFDYYGDMAHVTLVDGRDNPFFDAERNDEYFAHVTNLTNLMDATNGNPAPAA
jgi:hypothetical protein